MELNEKDKMTLQAWLDRWSAEGLSLPGCISYAYAGELVTKLDLECPQELTEILDGTFERKMRARKQAYEMVDAAISRIEANENPMEVVNQLFANIKQELSAGRASCTEPNQQKLPAKGDS